MDQFISKNDSKILKCVAICLMVFHHLFAFPERVAVKYINIFDFNFFHFETLLSYFGRICIVMFVFISGYGMSKQFFYDENTSLLEQYKRTIKKLWKFYTMYWLIMLVTLPYGFIKGIYKFELIGFIKNIIGLNCSYNAEWWYVWFYINLLLLFPLIFRTVNWIMRKSKSISKILVILLTVITIFFKQDFSYWMIVILSIGIVKYSLFDRLYNKIENIILIPIIGCICCFFLRSYIPLNIDFIISIFLCFFIVAIRKEIRINNLVESICINIGNYSMYIWLIHSFFCYYYFQNFTYSFYISWIIFIVCMTVSYMVGLLINKIYTYLKLISTLKI